MGNRVTIAYFDGDGRFTGRMHLLVSVVRLYYIPCPNVQRGPDRVAIYNEKFMPLAGKTHPQLMGSTFEEGFPELWSAMKPVFEGAIQTRAAVDVVEMEMFVERNKFTEEAYFSGNFVPIRGDNGEIEGRLQSFPFQCLGFTHLIMP
jgi:hypothetical protein